MSQQQSRPRRINSYPIDARGVPTSRAAYYLIQWLFTNRGRAHSVQEIAKATYVPADAVGTMCRQLRLGDMLCEEPLGERRYRYNLQCLDWELQAKVEAAITSCSAEHLPELL
jgi:hypothetical protein